MSNRCGDCCPGTHQNGASAALPLPLSGVVVGVVVVVISGVLAVAAAAAAVGENLAV